jgi:hypothetical protein
MIKLLAVCYGEAGSRIIASNMTGTGKFNPMVPGTKEVAIFGFCDIRQFTDATEVLQEGVMEYVNTIAQVRTAATACIAFRRWCC